MTNGFENIDPRVSAIYNPLFEEGKKDIIGQRDIAMESIFKNLEKRGMTSSNLLPDSLTSLFTQSGEAISGLRAKLGSEAGGISLTLDEMKRQEKLTKDWALLNQAIKFISPVITGVTGGIGTKIARGMLGSEGGGVDTDMLGDIFSSDDYNVGGTDDFGEFLDLYGG